MIIEFTLKNYKSIKDPQTLSFEAAPLVNRTTEVTKTPSGLNLLPVAGIFGPNASGKTNFIKALDFVRWAVSNSDYLNNPTTSHPLLQPFMLDHETQNEPSYFQLIVWDPEDDIEYRYGFEATKNEIVSEWLERKARAKKNYVTKLLFTRDHQSFELDKEVRKNLQHLTNNVKKQALAVSVFAQFDDPVSKKVVDLLSKKFVVFNGQNYDHITRVALEMCSENPDFLQYLVKFIKDSDIGIHDLHIKKQVFKNGALPDNFPDEIKSLINMPTNGKYTNFDIKSHHKVRNSKSDDSTVEFNFAEQESLGTNKLFALAAMILHVVQSDATLIFDEFGSSLHPFITAELVKLFRTADRNQSSYAQFLFTSHETYLLSANVDLRRDEIWFTEKDKNEETSLRSLAEYKTRSDYDFASRYLEGRFGAVPVTKFPDIDD